MTERITPEEPTAYMVYHDYDRDLTFRWNGASSHIEMHYGGLIQHQMDMIPLNGVPYDIHTGVGWVRWFQSICDAHIRLRIAAEEVVADGAER